jgi:hypothetical protein
MTASALFLAALGVAASFAPQEILTAVGAQPTGVVPLFIQIAGALCLGFAILNWTASGSAIGGIYNRPVALGNFFHYFVVSLALVKAVLAGPRSAWLIAGAVIYTLFALAFRLAGVLLLAGSAEVALPRNRPGHGRLVSGIVRLSNGNSSLSAKFYSQFQMKPFAFDDELSQIKRRSVHLLS